MKKILTQLVSLGSILSVLIFWLVVTGAACVSIWQGDWINFLVRAGAGTGFLSTALRWIRSQE